MIIDIVKIGDVLDHGKETYWRWQVNVTTSPNWLEKLLGKKETVTSWVLDKQQNSWLDTKEFYPAPYYIESLILRALNREIYHNRVKRLHERKNDIRS